MAVVEVGAGTAYARRRPAGRYDVGEVTFAPGCRLRWHAHPRSLIAVVVEGGLEKRYAHATHHARRATVIAMPAEEPHADRFGANGAQMVVVESGESLPATVAFESWAAAAIAHRMRAELSQPDQFTDLALEALALELTVLAARTRPALDVSPAWLPELIELLHDRACDAPSAERLAQTAGIEAAELARSFRAATGQSVGGYARNVRLDWAAARLTRTADPLARIACEAGFADQSHFTRAFSRRFGIAPGRYRRAHR